MNQKPLIIKYQKNISMQSKMPSFFFQTIKLALNERQQHFDELIKCSQLDDHGVKDKIDNLIQMWNQLTSLSNKENFSIYF